MVGHVDGGELVLVLGPRSLTLGVSDVAVNQAGVNWDGREVTLTLVLDLDRVLVLN